LHGVSKDGGALRAILRDAAKTPLLRMRSVYVAKPNSIHHQQIEHDHRRQREDHRPHPERPENVPRAEGRLLEKLIVLTAHDAPAFLVVAETIRVEF
jgi:hypothetical protein